MKPQYRYAGDPGASLRLAIVEIAADVRLPGQAQGSDEPNTELRQFLPTSDHFVIGRGPMATFSPALGGRLISNSHATVIKRPEGGWTVHDGLVDADGKRLGPPSTNGLFVAGRQTQGQPVVLQTAGDTVSLVSPQITGLTVSVVAVSTVIEAVLAREQVSPDFDTNACRSLISQASIDSTISSSDYAPQEQRHDITQLKEAISVVTVNVASLADAVTGMKSDITVIKTKDLPNIVEAISAVEADNVSQDVGLKLVRQVAVGIGALLLFCLIAAASNPDKRQQYIDTAIGLALSATATGAGILLTGKKPSSGAE